ncbi:hypothetical protein vseg_002999 [Gypsophila vaccaria]
MVLFEKEKRSQSKKMWAKVCNVCGDRGFSNALIYCSQCSDTTGHQYCVGIPPGSIDDINSWVCEYCSLVVKPESCTGTTFASASSEWNPENCIVHAEATTKSKNEIIVIPDQPAHVGTLYPLTCKENSENEKTRSCSQIANGIEKTGSIFMGYPECMSGEPVMLVKPSLEITSYFGITSFMGYLESIMFRVVFMVSPSGKIIIYRRKTFCDNLDAQNARDSAYGHPLKFVEEADFVRKVGPHTDAHDSIFLDEVIDTNGDFASDCSMEDIDPISVPHNEADVQGDTFFEHPFDASKNMDCNSQQSYEVLDVDGLAGMTSAYNQGLKRKRTPEAFEHLPLLKPHCKIARGKQGSSSYKEASKLGREEDVIKGEVCPRRSWFKRASRAKEDRAWMAGQWDGKDLRLKPDVHLSARAPQEAEGPRFYGSLTQVMESLSLLSEGARSIILGGALGPVVASWGRVAQLHAKVDKVLISGFLERFWDTTNSFHMPFGEVGITMTDFVMISGLPCSGHAIEFDEDLTLSGKGMRDLLGRHLPETVYKYCRQVPYSFFESYFRKDEGNMDEATDEQNARVWLWYFLGATFFAEKGSVCSTRYFHLLRDLDALGDYNWAAASYSNYIWYLRDAVRLKDPDSSSKVGVVGPGHILEAWIFAYFPSLMPNDLADPPFFPAVESFAACRQRRVFWSLNDVRKAINGLTTDDFVARPWLGYEDIPAFVAGIRIMDGTRVLLEGPFGCVWFLGERMARQTTTNTFVVPADPPLSMFRTARLRRGEAKEDVSGRPMIDFLLQESDYRKYVARRLAWQAIEVPGADYLSDFLSQLKRLLQR